jgi:uncharacterized protein (DUF2141 family)
MKRLNSLLLTLAAVFVFSESVIAQGKLEVVVKNIKVEKGKIMVGLFVSEDSFLKNATLGKVIQASGTEVHVIFEDIKPGEYGLSIIHDENENGELDTNMMGIPTEGFAFGNNAMGMFGPPSFEKAKIKIEDKKSASQTITLKYL